MSLNFVSLDFETANPSRASACSIGLVRVENGSVVETKNYLFRPPPGFDDFNAWNISIHGITPDMVSAEPRFGDLWPEIKNFIGRYPVVAHNASFDLSVLRAALTASEWNWPNISYACTMVMSRAMFDLTSHSLSHVAHEARIHWDEDKHHDALYDAEICAQIAISMAKSRAVEELSDLLISLGLSMGRLNADGWETCRSNSYRANQLGHIRARVSAKELDINSDADPSHPLYGKTIVFTGNLHSMSRNDAWIEIAKIGAIPVESVTKTTNVIVVGQQDFTKLKDGETQSGKFRKAEKLKQQGQEIEVIHERDFLAYIEPMEGRR
jgi:DNA polymerase-3 subunit epsilon